MGFKYGQMGQNTKVNGSKTQHVDMASFTTLMEMCMKATGLTISQMDQEYIDMQMEPSTQGSGKMISSKVKGLNTGQMGLNMWELTSMGKSMVKVF